MFDVTQLTMQSFFIFWQRLEVEVEVEEVEVVLGQRPWEDCSVEECLNYDQSEPEVCFPLTVGSEIMDFY